MTVPIWFIIWMLLAFGWLMWQTKFLTIHLLVGPEPEIIKCKRKSWKQLKPWSISKYDPFWLRHPDNMSPLCGWQWLENTMHIIPENRVELYFGNGYRQTFTLKRPSLMKEIIRINTGKKFFAKVK